MKERTISSLVIAVGLCGAGLGAAPEVDYAESGHVDQWLRHPVCGDPSFDSFERLPGNPIHRGQPPFEWPVNGFFFADPVGGNWYIYVGDYGEGYLSCSSRCTLFRSADHGQSWESLGPVLQGDPAMFDKNGHTPDVSVVYADGRYHMLYDWAQAKDGHGGLGGLGGLAYAWAAKPEGPFHRAEKPLIDNATLTPLLGRYRRTYGGTLIRRKSDWLILGLLDAAPNAWTMFAVTAPKPEGPYSERQLVRNVESDYFHPPLMEGYPAFAHEGYVYAPATSVALNRNFQGVFRAPIERATDAGAWEVFRHGSFWHSEDVEHESCGLWGQTPSCWIDSAGTLWAMFNSRDSKNKGTVNLARRPWNQPFRPRGFVLTGHGGPSLTCLRPSFHGFQLEATLRLRGTARLFWDFHAPLGPDKPGSDSTLHPLMRTRHQAVELSPTRWKVISVDAKGQAATLASGSVAQRSEWLLRLRRQPDGSTVLAANGETLWQGPAIEHAASATGAIGLLVESHSHLVVDRFRVAGQPVKGSLRYLYTEALLGAGERSEDWQDRSGPDFCYGVGAVSRRPQTRVKWNVVGSQFTLWSPRGPEFGQIEIRVDGRIETVVDLRSDKSEPSRPLWTSRVLSDAAHAVVLQGVAGVFPIDSLEAWCDETTAPGAP
jgi:hypothetical protein